MKTFATVCALTAILAVPAWAEEGDSTLEKAAKLKAAQEIADNEDDSSLKKAAKMGAAKNVIDDEEDSALKKAAKLKVLDEATK